MCLDFFFRTPRGLQNAGAHHDSNWPVRQPGMGCVSLRCVMLPTSTLVLCGWPDRMAILGPRTAGTREGGTPLPCLRAHHGPLCRQFSQFSRNPDVCVQACTSGLFDESMSSFFRNVDTRYDVSRDIPLLRGPDARNPIRSLKARAILIDMEEGVVSQVRCRLLWPPTIVADAFHSAPHCGRAGDERPAS